MSSVFFNSLELRLVATNSISLIGISLGLGLLYLDVFDSPLLFILIVLDVLELSLVSVLLSLVATEFGVSLKSEGNLYSERIGTVDCTKLLATKYYYLKYSY